MHWNETLEEWEDITTSVDTANNIIHGITASFSIFTVMERTDCLPPVITAEFIRVHNHLYRFEFTITDDSDPDPFYTAVILIPLPANLSEWTVMLRARKKPGLLIIDRYKTVIVFDSDPVLV